MSTEHGGWEWGELWAGLLSWGNICSPVRVACAFPVSSAFAEGRPPVSEPPERLALQRLWEPRGWPGLSGAGAEKGRAVPSPPRTVSGSTGCLAVSSATFRALCVPQRISQPTPVLQMRRVRLRGGDTPTDTEKRELVPPMGPYSFRLCSVGRGLWGALPATLTLPGRAPATRKELSPHPWELRSALRPQPVSLPPRAVVPAPTRVRPPRLPVQGPPCSP